MRLAFETPVDAPRESVFGFFEAPGNLEVLMHGWRGFRLVSAAERVRKGLVVRVRVPFGPLPVSIAFRHGPHRPPRHMGERAIEGPFSRFVHHHGFEERGDSTIVRDVLDLRLPWHLGGRVAERLLVAPFVRRMFAFRARRLAELARVGAFSAAAESRRIPWTSCAPS